MNLMTVDWNAVAAVVSFSVIAVALISDCISLNVPPISLSNVPGISE